MFQHSHSDRTFEIVGNDFLKDGQPYRYISGSFHYFRETAKLWEDRIMKMANGGYTTVQTYIAWNWHELEHGKFNWDGDHDLDLFLSICEKYNLTVILRPGPYICAEWAFGGFPVWLHNLEGIKTIRGDDVVYQNAVKVWFTELARVINPHLYQNGGSIILVQLENEYGSYPVCSKNYLSWLADLWKQLLGNIQLFTTDGNGQGYLDCGALPSRAYATVDFGPGSNPQTSFELERAYNGGSGPYVNSEYYTGWLDHWGESHQRHDGDDVARWLDTQLGLGGSVDAYMAFGGTSLFPGANGDTGTNYQPQPTSYDYDSPISECGDMTYKYSAMLDVIRTYRTDIPVLPVRNSTKKAYGTVEFTQGVALVDALDTVAVKSTSDAPQTFDVLGQDFGYVLYETEAARTVPGTLQATAWDRSVVLVNDTIVGQTVRPNKINISVNTGKLGILVETLGRLNYGGTIWNDWKGIANATLNGEPVTGWTQWQIPLLQFSYGENDALPWTSTLPVHVPAFYKGTFVVDDEPADTFLNPSGLGRGAAFVNGVFIGNYWTVGPQLTLYVRAHLLKTGVNELVVFESSEVGGTVPKLTFEDHAILDIKPTPIN